MDLLEVLSLALALNVELWVEGEKLRVAPLDHIVPELDEGIKENRNELIAHIRREQESWQYELLVKIAKHGITLRLDEDGTLRASPGEEVLASGLRGEMAENKAFLVDVLTDRGEKVGHAAEVHLLARQKWDTSKWEEIPSVDNAWSQPDKAQFFREGNKWLKNA